MNVVMIYLYGLLYKDIYMIIPEGFKKHEAFYYKPRSVYSIKLQKSLLGRSNVVEYGIIILMNTS